MLMMIAGTTRSAEAPHRGGQRETTVHARVEEKHPDEEERGGITPQPASQPEVSQPASQAWTNCVTYIAERAQATEPPDDATLLIIMPLSTLALPEPHTNVFNPRLLI